MLHDVRSLGATAAFTPAPIDEPSETNRFRPRLLADLRLQTSSAWLIKGVLPATGWGLIFGASTTGKSFVALDLIAAIATGASWNGRRTLQGAAVYVALEGGKDAEHRLIAFRESGGVPIDAPILFVDEALSLIEECDPPELADEIADLADGIAAPVRLVVIDTLARAAAGAQENDASDMTLVVAAAEEIGRSLDCLVLLVHHAPWDAQRPRGSSALYGAADVILKVSRSEAARSLEIEKLKMGRDGEAWDFTLEPIELGVDEDGDPITSCLVDWIGETRAAQRIKLSAKQQIAKRALVKIISSDGAEIPGHLGEPVRAVTRQQWRSQAFADGVTDAVKQKNRNDAARRVEDALLAMSIVSVRNDMVWLCDDATDCDRAATVAAERSAEAATDRDRAPKGGRGGRTRGAAEM